jgi:hypothetical protein
MDEGGREVMGRRKDVKDGEEGRKQANKRSEGKKEGCEGR